MKRLKQLLNRVIYAVAASLVAWVSCTLPLDNRSLSLTTICRVFGWPVRTAVAAAITIGWKGDALAIGWCDFCSAETRLYRSLLTAVPVYVALFYLPTLALWLVRKWRRRRELRSAETPHHA